ncbi:MAG: hypothetical protein JWM95_2330 [Gemmatimonadetes bacterium]|nr:hypothetical protein [Gemmatimonadota bacterium]
MAHTTPEFINLKTADLDQNIYRIFGLQRFLELTETSLNTLVRPRLWDDPFENALLSAPAATSTGSPFTFGFRDSLYGQCWTTKRDSDAMWRIYSSDKAGVRLRTTIRALVASLRDTCVTFPELSCFIGRVEYLSQTKLMSRLGDPSVAAALSLDPTGRGQATSLLMKRTEFSHEREVRLVHFTHDPAITGDVYQYTCDAPFLFDEVAFDPRLSPQLLALYAQHVRTLGFANVIQSPLYRLPTLRIRLHGV